MDYHIVDQCRCCGRASLEAVLDLGAQPLANSYVREPEAQPVYPLELFVCRQCYHSQLGVVVNPDLMFRHYLYVSGTSRTFRTPGQACPGSIELGRAPTETGPRPSLQRWHY